jgi:hypothetical protein
MALEKFRLIICLIDNIRLALGKGFVIFDSSRFIEMLASCLRDIRGHQTRGIYKAGSFLICIGNPVKKIRNRDFSTLLI